MDKKKITYFTLIMALGTFVVVMDNTIMNVSIQALVEDLGTNVSGVQSAIALNALMMAAFVLFGGKLADIIGMKRTFITGVLLYISGSLLASLSNNLTVFILGWCLIQGLGAALMLPNVQTIIRANLGGNDRVKAYGAMAGVNALGAAMGPIIGGFLTTYFSWRWAFRLEVIALVVILAFHGLIPRDKTITQRTNIDMLGTGLQASAMMSLVLGILLISDYGLFFAKKPFEINGVEISPFNLGLSPTVWLLALGVILLMLFIRLENRNVHNNRPTLIHLALFKIGDFVNGLKVRAIQVSLLAGILFTAPLFMQVSFGISAFNTGIALLPLSIFLIIGAVIGVKAGKKYLPKTIIQVGSSIMILGALVLVSTMNTSTKAFELSWGLGILGLGSGLIGSQIVNLILSSVRQDQTAEASGLTSTLEQVGNSVGVAILGTVLTLSLSLGLTQQFNQQTDIPADIAQRAQQKIEQGVEVVSDQQIRSAVTELTPDNADQLLQMYDTARTNAFRITMLAVAFAALVMFILSRSLPAKQVATTEA